MIKKTVIIAAVMMALVGVVFGVQNKVAAITADEEVEYSLNDIMFYDSCTGGMTVDCGIKISGKTIEEKIWSGLTSFMTEEQAAGVMGNMAHEGGLNPARHESAFLDSDANFAITTDADTSYGIGLIQWSFGRRIKLLEYIKEKADDLLEKYIDSGRETYGRISGQEFLSQAGDSDTDMLVALELCYLKQELDSGYSGIYATNTVEEASNYFLEHVEKPANAAAQKATRYKDAQKYYDEFKGKIFEDDANSDSEDPCDSNIEGSKNINGAAVALAWPLGTEKSKYSWKNGTGTELFNEVYPKLIPKGSRKSYQGCDGPIYGASCDRFVSTVVRYSGYDKNFPTGVGLSEGSQGGYPLKHKDLWERIDWDGDPADLKAGDVVLRSGHVAIAVQDENGKFYIAEAGLCNSYGHIRKIKSKENFDYIIRATKAKNSNVGVSVTDGVKSSSTTGMLTTGTGQNNGDINGSAIALAWPLGTTSKTSISKAYDKFVEFYNSLEGYKNRGGQRWQDGKSCSVFVNTVLLYAGAVKGSKVRSPGGIIDYMIEHPDEWEEVEGSGTGNLKYSDLQGGDVLIYYRAALSPGNDSKYNFRGLHVGHAALYVEDNNDSLIAEAHFEAQWGHLRKQSASKRVSSQIRVFRWKKQNGGANCNLCSTPGDGSEMQLKAGGMTLAEAREFMSAYKTAAMGKYYKRKYSITFQGATITNANCPYGVMNNCVAFSQWFINKYTTIGPNWTSTTDGVGMVNKLVSTKGLKKGNADSPRPYAIFSNAQWSGAGHTGVVLGVDENTKKIVVGEASCSWSAGHLYYEPRAKEYSFDYIKKNNWSFAYTDEVLSKGGVLKDV